MDAVKRENRVLRVAVVVLFGALVADAAMSGQDQVQRFPGLGTGVVPVKVTEEVGVTQQGDWKVAQQGDWKVAQQGDWKVGVTGTVVTLPAMPNLVAVNRTYTIYWDHVNSEAVTVREIHASGWARVDIGGGQRWINLTRATSVVGR